MENRLNSTAQMLAGTESMGKINEPTEAHSHRIHKFDRILV